MDDRERLEAQRDHLLAMIEGSSSPGRRIQLRRSQAELERVEYQLARLPAEPDDDW